MTHIRLFATAIVLLLPLLPVTQPCQAQEKPRNLRKYKTGPDFHFFYETVQIMARKKDQLEKYVWNHWKIPQKTKFRAFYYSREGQNIQICQFSIEPDEANKWQIAIECGPGSDLKEEPAAFFTTKEVFDSVERYEFDDNGELKSTPLPLEREVPVSEYILVIRDSTSGKTKRLGYTRKR
jgi:hypothetical protein